MEAVTKEDKFELYLGTEGTFKAPNRKYDGRLILGAQAGLEGQ